jgi:hypothetical protein
MAVLEQWLLPCWAAFQVMLIYFAVDIDNFVPVSSSIFTRSFAVVLGMCHDFRRSWSLSLFRQRSAVDVNGLLAIANSLFIFHLFCLCFTHLVSIPQLHVHYLTLCFPHGFCAWLFYVCSVHYCGLGITTCYWNIWVKLLVLLISAVLRLTPLHQLHPDHNRLICTFRLKVRSSLGDRMHLLPERYDGCVVPWCLYLRTIGCTD